MCACLKTKETNQGKEVHTVPLGIESLMVSISLLLILVLLHDWIWHKQNLNDICSMCLGDAKYTALSLRRDSFLQLEHTEHNVTLRNIQSCEKLIINLHWLLVKPHITYKILLVTYKSLNALAPQYLSDLLHPHRLWHYGPQLWVWYLSLGPTSIPFEDRAFTVADPTLYTSLLFESVTFCFYILFCKKIIGFLERCVTNLNHHHHNNW